MVARVTLAHVARLAGVSQTTASFVLSGRRVEMRISPEVEARVLRAVQETGYRPNVVSRSLRTGTTNTIGFISDTVATTPFAGHLIWGALDAAREHDHLLVIAETEGDKQLEREAISMMHDRSVDGIILASMSTRRVSPPTALLDRPSVLLNGLPMRPGSLTSVVPDEVEAGRSAARVLVQAGYRDGIFIVGAGTKPSETPRGALAAAERLVGIREVLEEAGTHLAGGVMLTAWQPRDGYDATRSLLDRTPEPEALVCFNDRLSVGAYQALEDAGRKVGEDVSIVSFDDDPVASWLRPQLTSIALPHYELGKCAVEILLSGGGRERSGARVHRVPMPVRLRDSVRKPIT
ncbi:MAG TPA: LacI family DNA-binding transcriptional regulator [Acidimicrobiales bacterium]|nr:LacI family DNA-binding transcriptional regulator [Acidimicrobiales bacterium]